MIAFNHYNSSNRLSSFIVSGDWHEWPEATVYKLANILWSGDRQPEKIGMKLHHAMNEEQAVEHFRACLIKSLGINTEPTTDTLKTSLQALEPQIFFHKIHIIKAPNPIFLRHIIEYWENALESSRSPSHVLVFVIEDILEQSNKQASHRSWLDFFRRSKPKQTKNTLAEYEQKLQAHGLHKHLLPKLNPPSKRHLNSWIDEHLPIPDNLLAQKELLREILLSVFEDDESMPHHQLLIKLSEELTVSP
jgi:hypothetical protein